MQVNKQNQICQVSGGESKQTMVHSSFVTQGKNECASSLRSAKT